MALNVAPDVTHFSGIVPCGISASHCGVTSLCDRGINLSLSDVDLALLKTFERTFGATVRT
jgi:lipoyl(octanoyl) transferase